MWLVTLVKFHYKNCSQHRTFPLPCCPRAGTEDLNDIRTTISSKIRGSGFVEAWSYNSSCKKKISKKDVYKDYSATADISLVAVRQNGDFTSLK